MSKRHSTWMAQSVVQFSVDALLDGRPVSTFTDNRVVRWTTGVDQHDGFATLAAIIALKQTGPGLPDDGVFAANAEHPQIALHFSNAAAASSGQAHALSGAGSIELTVPPAQYAQLFVAVTSSSGDCALHATFDYASGEATSFDFTLPDWGTGKPLPTNPPIFFNLISGLHKWDEQDNSVDTPSHSLTGVVLAPDAARVLVKLELGKSSNAQELVFWGATGVAESADAESGGASGGGGTSGDGASGSRNEGGASGSDGASGSAGATATGGAGMTSGAGSAGTSAGAPASAGTSSDGSSGASSALGAPASSTAHTSGGSTSSCSVSARASNTGAECSVSFALVVALVAIRRRSARAKPKISLK